MTILPMLLAAAAYLPSDRMAMADRMFDAGDYDGAKAEYAALRGVQGVAEDELLFRLAETARVKGDAAGARASYLDLVRRYPRSRHADRARLKGALAGTPEQQKTELPLLDTDGVALALRAEALYHLGEVNGDPKAFARCVRLDPKGPFAVAARFRQAALLGKSEDPTVRREALGILQELSKVEDRSIAQKALFMAVCNCYSENTDLGFKGARKLASRYLRAYPDSPDLPRVRTMGAWSYYQVGEWSDAEVLCGEAATDDLAYLRAACALAKGKAAEARALFNRYLEDYPQGRYRASAELQHARLSFVAAKDGDDKALIVEAARRSARLSKGSNDRLRYAWALENAGRTDEAVAEYASLATDFPKTADGAEALLRKAMIDIRASRWSDAAQSLKDSLSSELTPARKAEALYWLGYSYSRLGHDTEGVTRLREALALGIAKDPEREARLIIADNDYKSGRKAEAKVAYATLIREDAEACNRMSAERLRSVGRFLLSAEYGAAYPEEAASCGRFLAENGGTPEWKQAGYVLKGASEEASGSFARAIESYRLAMRQPVSGATDDLPAAVLALGVLEAKAGQCAEAEATLCKAVRLNAKVTSARVKAYLWLAKACHGQGRDDDARRYATIVTTLFDDKEAAAEAERLLQTLPEVKK